jgi:serine/threonine-protein kinase RsbW
MGRGCGRESLSNKSRTTGSMVQVKVSIRSAINEISPLIDRLMRLIRKGNCVVGEEINVEIALREAVTNAVLHGNKADPEKRVAICCEVGLGSGVSVIVRDEGQGFDPANVSDPTTTENIGSDHGRGIYLMRALMDEVHFEQGGTEVHMRKGFKYEST